jgi:hypothetical protein
MKKFYRFLISGALASCFLLFAVAASANITLTNGKWSTTFNCSDWTYPPDSPSTGCDGLDRGTDSLTYSSQITSSANNPSGGGGEGFAWKVGNGNVTTTSTTSSNLGIAWSGSSHFWIRWYVRIPAGLSIGYGGPNIYGWKVLYLWNAAKSQSVYIDANYNGVGMSMYDRSNRINGPYGVSDAIGSTTSDGSWIAIEMEFDIPNHTWRYWFYKNNVDDPTPKFQSSSVNYPISSIGYINFPSNIRSSQISNAPVAIDFDDIAISENGRIGPIGSGGIKTPAAPKSLRIMSSSSGSTGSSLPPATSQTLLTEGFDDNNFASRGWFDNTSMSLDTSVKHSGAASTKWTWAQGATLPTGTSTIRHDFTATDSLYVSFYWRFNSDWGGGTDLSYQPHLVYILSDADDHWGALANNYLDTYLQVTDTTPVIQIQDVKNINTNPTPPWTSTMGTENRAVAGCNGNTVGSDPGDLYDCYGSYMNYRRWNGTTGNMSKGTWHHVEAFLKMNTISGGIAQPDGIMQEWIDGAQTINKNNIVFRTGQHANMKWSTLVLAPYIGNTAPHAETMWMDDLTIGTNIPGA